MDAAKAAINKLTSGHGKHTTDVTESYRPAVTHEQINPQQEHVSQEVRDREIHQEHHHTSVLPVHDTKVLPTEHTHNLAATKHVEHHHGDHKGVHDKVAAEAAQFRDHTQTAPTKHTESVNPTITGEHVHHHVHETIQPVIQRQTVQPSVVHTTIPTHETIHNEPKHYTASALPAVSLDQFQKEGGSLTGLADRTEHFKGEPSNIVGSSGHHSSTTGTSGLTSSSTTGTTSTSGLTGSSTTGTTGTSGLTGSSATGTSTAGTSTINPLSSSRDIDPRLDGTTSKTGAVPSAATSSHSNPIAGPGHSSTTHDSTGKPSLLQKLNPFKDADGDGKKGFMD